MDTQRTLDAARLRVSLEFPYLSQAVWALRGPVMVRGLMLQAGGAIGVDQYWRLYMDPDMTWTISQLATALRHEVWHCLRDHAGRKKNRCARRWNLATDCSVNSDMQAERGVAVAGRSSSAPDWPYEGVFPSTFGLADHLLEEEYYALIPKHDHPQQDSGGNGDESGDSSTSGQSNSSQSAPASQRQQSDCIGCGRCSGAPSPGGSNSDGVPRVWEQGADGKIREVTGAEADAIRQSVAEQIRSQAEKGQGSIPVGAMRWAEERLTPPKVPWQQVLRGAVRAVVAQLAGMVDYSRQRPSRRQAVSQSEVMLPTLVRPTPKVAVVIDTSGSMSDEQLRLAVSEVQGVITASGSEEVAVLSCDTAAYAPKKVVSARSVTLQGGGGTDMGVGIQACMKLRPRPDVVIVITDGLTGWDVDPPPFRTVVCLVGDHAPFDTCPSWAKVVEVDS